MESGYPSEFEKSVRLNTSVYSTNREQESLVTPWLLSPTASSLSLGYKWAADSSSPEETQNPDDRSMIDTTDRDVITTHKQHRSTALRNSSPPALENPENVVPSSDTARYEKHFIPNVALQQNDEPSVVKTGLLSSRHDGVGSTRNPVTDKSARPPNRIYILEELANMKLLFSEVLDASNISEEKKDRFNRNYASYNDSVRQHLLTHLLGT